MNNIIRRNSPLNTSVYDSETQELIQIKELNRNLLKDRKFDLKIIKGLLYTILVISIVLVSVAIYIYVKDDDNNNNDIHYPNISNGTIHYIDKTYIQTIINELYTNNDYSIKNYNIKNDSNHSKIANIEYIFNDNIYILPSLEFIQTYINNDKTDLQKYIAEKNDCDNFSFIVFGNFLKLQNGYNLSNSILFGIAYTVNKNTDYYHTINIFVDEYLKIYCIESQTDIMELCKNYKYTIFRIIF